MSTLNRYKSPHHFRDATQMITWEFCEGFLDGPWCIVFSSDNYGKYTVGQQLWTIHRDENYNKDLISNLKEYFWRHCRLALIQLNVSEEKAEILGKQVHQEFLQWLREIGVKI